MSKIIATYPKPRKERDKSGRRYRVEYDLAYDGGGSEWIGYYRTRLVAAVAIRFNRHIASWGGTAVLYDRRGRKTE